jgi:hypothetical protein
MKAARMAMLGIGSILVAYLVTAYLMNAMAEKRNRYLIPEGYTGWLCVSYGVAGAPVLEMEEGFRLVRFPETGEVVTATSAMPGQHKDEFFYYKGDQRQRVDASREIGGGYSSKPDNETGGYTFRFWVSRNAGKDIASMKGEGFSCGPV